MSAGALMTTNPIKSSKKRVQTFFEHKGIKPVHIPQAIFFHEILGLTLLAITWSTCYWFPPSKNAYLQKPIQKMSEMIPVSLSSRVNSNPIFGSKLGSSYLESSCLRKLVRPFTLPGKLYLTYLLVQRLSGNEETETISPSF